MAWGEWQHSLAVLPPLCHRPHDCEGTAAAGMRRGAATTAARTTKDNTAD